MLYRAPRWLPGGHAQTLYAVLISGEPLAYRRERWETPDQDFIDLDWTTSPKTRLADPQTPLVVLFHGLEGSSGSHYARALMRHVADCGWAGVVAHFRGCSGEPNRLARAYHSGDSDEIDWILRRLRARYPHRPIHVVGVSLGGNALLKWLGEREDAAAAVIHSAAAVSAPLDLAACGHHLDRGFNKIYTRHFLATLKPTAREKLRRFPEVCNTLKLRRAHSLHAFDDVFTGPLHGFAGADDYWQRASSKPWLNGIRIPTLIINARNDPFMPPGILPGTHEVSSSVELEFPAEGGHVGFVLGPWPGNLAWMPERLTAFFRSRA